MTRLLPARLMGSFVYLLSRSRRPWLKNALIRGFLRLYDVDTEEAAREIPEGYATFNEFFTRELRPDARPVHSNPDQLLSPADGTIAQTGHAHNGHLLQAKGIEFSATGLLANSLLASKLVKAPFATVYLAPYNYHRVHMPVAGRLRQTIFVPGKLYSVNARTTATIPELYALNERLVCEFETDRGPFALVLVGAMNVASISTAWGGEIFPPADKKVIHSDYTEQTIELAQGEYMGHFNMGSTVVMLGPAGNCAWHESLQPGQPVQVGTPIGELVPA
ncbi:MAG: phosphatidylserine decarboxylase [Gammaproteobacteria bacterium]|nr:phosphatidylserine decarboxylase [Gammaproteobacteria bacterium]